MALIKALSRRTIVVGIFFLVVISCNQKKGKNEMDTKDNMNKVGMTVDQRDSTFMVEANGINLEEIKLGKLAQDKSSTVEVGHLADMLVMDHTLLKRDLVDLTWKTGMALSDSLNSNARKAYDDLDSISETEFDKKYTDMMVKGHKQAIALFEKDSAETKDAAVRQYATTALPILRKHLAHAEAARDEVGK